MDPLYIVAICIAVVFWMASFVFRSIIRSVVGRQVKSFTYAYSAGFVGYVLVLSCVAFFSTVGLFSFIDGICITAVSFLYYAHLKSASKQSPGSRPVEDLKVANSLVDAAVTLMRHHAEDMELDCFPVSFFEKNGFDGMDFDARSGELVLHLSCGVRKKDRDTLLGFLPGFPSTLNIESVSIAPKDLPKWLVDTQDFQDELNPLLEDLDNSKLSASVLSELRKHLIVTDVPPDSGHPELDRMVTADVAAESMERIEDKKKARRERNLRIRVRRMAREIAKKEVQRYMSKPWEEETCNRSGGAKMDTMPPEKGKLGGRAV